MGSEGFGLVIDVYYIIHSNEHLQLIAKFILILGYLCFLSLKFHPSQGFPNQFMWKLLGLVIPLIYGCIRF